MLKSLASAANLRSLALVSAIGTVFVATRVYMASGVSSAAEMNLGSFVVKDHEGKDVSLAKYVRMWFCVRAGSAGKHIQQPCTQAPPLTPHEIFATGILAKLCSSRTSRRSEA